QAVTRLARPAGADRIGNDDEVCVAVEQLSLLEELPGEIGGEKIRTGPAGTVQQQHRVPDDTGLIAPRRADRPVVQPQLGYHFACLESEISDDVVTFDGCGIR